MTVNAAHCISMACQSKIGKPPQQYQVPTFNMGWLRLYSGLHPGALTTVVDLMNLQETATALFGPVSLSDPCNLINFTLYLYLMVL